MIFKHSMNLDRRLDVVQPDAGIGDALGETGRYSMAFVSQIFY
jgi:hypothetical protein